jgi:hypothetical protein
MIDPVEFGKAMGALIREATAPLLRRIEELEARKPIPAEPVSDEAIVAAVAKHLADNPPASGKDADPVSTEAIASAVAKHLSENPPAPGRDADPVTDARIAGEVWRYMGENPPANGKDAIPPTADDVAACFERRFSEFLLSGERRIFDMADKAIDRMPRAKDGLDGIGWDDMTVEYDGERTVTLVFEKGDEQRTYPLVLPIVLDKGFWQEGTEAAHNDGFTFGGSYWIAQKATDTKPEIGNPDWRLAVRKGRDGKRVPA